jgi:hypothetical protein
MRTTASADAANFQRIRNLHLFDVRICLLATSVYHDLQVDQLIIDHAEALAGATPARSADKRLLREDPRRASLPVCSTRTKNA